MLYSFAFCAVKSPLQEREKKYRILCLNHNSSECFAFSPSLSLAVGLPYKINSKINISFLKKHTYTDPNHDDLNYNFSHADWEKEKIFVSARYFRPNYLYIIA